MSAETSQVRCPAWASTRPSAAVTSVLPSPCSALVTSTIRWLVGRQVHAERRLQRLVGLVLDRAQRVRRLAEPASDERDLDQHREVEQAAQLPRAADARPELGAGEHDERGDEDAREEREDRVAHRLRRARASGRLRAPRRAGARSRCSRSEVEVGQPLADRGDLGPIWAWFSGRAATPGRSRAPARARRAGGSARCSTRRCLARNVAATTLAIAAAPRAVSSLATMLMMFAFWSTVACTLPRSESTVSPFQPVFAAAASSSACREEDWTVARRAGSTGRPRSSSECGVSSRTSFEVAW